MALDPNIILQGAQQQQNPLLMATNAAQLKNVMLNNQTAQNQLYGQQALGNALTGNVRPDGTVDSAAVINQLVRDPYGARILPQVQQQLLANDTAQAGLGSAQAKLSQDQIDAHRSAMGLIADGLQRALSDPTITDDNLHTYAAQIYTSKDMSPTLQSAMLDDYTKLMSGMPPESDQQARRNYLGGIYASVLANHEAFNQRFPSPTAVNTGGQTQFVAGSGLTPPQTVGQPLQNTMTQGERQTAAWQQYNPQTQQTETVTKGAAADADATGQPPKSIVAAPAAGDLAAQTTEGTGNAQQALALQSRAAQVPQNKALLDNLRGEMQNFKPGSTADWTLAAKRFVNSASPFGSLFDPSKIASQEDFNKQATQLAQSQFQALGGTGTDAKLNSTMHTSPSTALSSMGDGQILALLEGNEDAIKVQNQSWQNFKQQNGPNSYGQFQAKFSNVFDPRVFQYQYLQPSEQQAMLKAMNQKELAQFDQHMSVAKKAGWLTQ